MWGKHNPGAGDAKLIAFSCVLGGSKTQKGEFLLARREGEIYYGDLLPDDMLPPLACAVAAIRRAASCSAVLNFSGFV